ncbi:MAG TPA: glycosyltransferase family 4 protein [Gemmatimonadales bacterium]|nr:glycosyltransferase family 4 protein [Gemmatimonadales bacterium]
MRIALIAEDYYPQVGGIAEHVHHLALELERMGHTATVIGSHMAGDAAQDRTRPYAVHRIGRSVVIYANGGISRITVGMRLRRQLVALLSRGQFDVVHVHGPLALTFGVITPVAARRAGIPLVGTFHSWFPRSRGYRLFRRGLQRRLDLHRAVIAVSEPVALAHARYFRADWQIIPNGVNTGWYHPNGRDGRRDLRASGPRLLYLHRLEPRNNLGTLIAAMPRILAAYPNAELVVAGDGPWRSYYERQARSFGDRVRFLGTVSDPAECYRAADLYLCPTMRAGFGITLLEAMACGTPIVVADNPGFRYVLDGGKAGIRLPHDKPEAWGDAVVELLGDAARREAMGKAGVQKAGEFAWPVVAQKIVQVYERVVG